MYIIFVFIHLSHILTYMTYIYLYLCFILGYYQKLRLHLRMIRLMNKGLKRMQNGDIVACFEALFRHLPGEAEDTKYLS